MRIFLFVLSLVLVPGFGMFAAVYGSNEIMTANDLTSADSVTAICATSQSDACGTFSTLQLLFKGSLIALIVSLALPAVYLLVATILGRNRTWLAHGFPILVRVVLSILPVLLAMQGVLVWVASWELVQMDVIPGDWRLMLVLAGIGGSLVLAAITIIADLRRMLEIDPLRVLGVEVGRSEMPALFARVARIAAQLGSREPERIIIGIEPNAFIANTPIRLRGLEDLPAAVTLYLPTAAFRVFDDAELDALIGHELGHFRGADLEFSNRFVPAYRSLSVAANSVSNEGEDRDATSIALMPAIGMLGFMMHTIAVIVGRINRERELAADRAGLEVSNPAAITSLLVKFSALSLRWESFRRGWGNLLRQGVSRRNMSRDYLEHVRQFLAAFDPEKLRRGLLALHVPHPLDSHPTLEVRARAVGIDPASVLDSGLAALRIDRPALAELDAIEQRITEIDADFYRHPANPVVISDDAALPPELGYTVRQERAEVSRDDGSPDR